MLNAALLKPALLLLVVLAVLAVYQTGAAQPGPNQLNVEGDVQGIAVVELFTSQGCSSCPPADRVLTQVADLAGENSLPIYALSMHVDYWNYLGWEDPYSTRLFSERQRRYASATGSSRVYTPQMIVNGGTEFVGSNARLAQAAIRQAVSQPASAEVALNVAAAGSGGNEWKVDYRVTGAAAGDEVVVCLVADADANDVPRGENGGRKLAHSGVVRTLASGSLDANGTGSLTIAWPTAQPRGDQSLSVVAFVQNRRTMAITGASRWTPRGA